MTNGIDQLLEQWSDAERTGDAGQLDALLADDFAGIGPVGFVLDRDAWLARFGMGLHYDALRLEEVCVHPHGAAVFVVAHQHAIGHAGNVPTPPDTRVSFTIVPDDGERYRIAAIQYSFIGPPLGPPR
jgi:ketosteroid isomerase-like protein